MQASNPVLAEPPRQVLFSLLTRFRRSNLLMPHGARVRVRVRVRAMPHGARTPYESRPVA
eukprot:scaffold48214_cov40-Phaeocystis_antarctica.AAC.2